MQTAEKKAPDWAQIEAEVRAGGQSIRAIARTAGISETAIRKRARKGKWVRTSANPAANLEAAASPGAQQPNDRRRAVVVLACDGMSEEQIALVLSMTVEELRRDFQEALDNAHALARAEDLLRLDRAAAAGNVSALKRREELSSVLPLQMAPRLGKKAQAAIDAAHPDTSTPLGKLIAERSGYIGKKEIAHARAQELAGKGGKFAPPPPPGKKVAAQLAAETAGMGSEWGTELIAPGPQKPN